MGEGRRGVVSTVVNVLKIGQTVKFRGLTQLLRRFGHVNWTMADQASVSAVNFLTGLLLARGLGITEFGIFSLAWVVVLFVFSLQFAMISAPMLSIAPKIEAAERPSYFGSVVLQHLLFTLATAMLVWVGAALSSHFYPTLGIDAYALPLMATTAAHQTRDFLRRQFYATHRHMAAFFIDAFSYGGQLAILVALFALEKLTIITALWTITGISTLAAFGASFWIGPLLFRLDDLLVVVKRHWRFSRWLGASALLNLFADQFLLVVSGAFIGPAAAGAMKAAQNLMGIAQLMFFALENIVPVRAGSYYHTGGIDALVAFMVRVTKWSASATALIVLTFCIYPEFWLQLIFGDQFVGYGILVRLYGIAFLLKAFGFAFGAGYYALEDTRPIFLAYTIATAAVALATYPLLKNFGVTGSAAGAVIFEVLMVSVVGLGFVSRVRRLRRSAVIASAN